MMRKALTVSMVVLVMLGLLGAAGGVVAQEEEMDAASVVKGIYDAVEANDIDAAMDLVAENAVLVIIPPPPGLSGVFIGPEEMRAWFTGLAADNGRAEFSDITVSGNGATWKAKWYGDQFEDMGVIPLEFEGVSIAQGGKLKSATWVFEEDFYPRVREAENKAAVRAYLEAWEQADLDALDALLTEDFVNHSMPLPPDREGMKEFAAESRSQFTDGEYTITKLVAEDDLVFVFGHFQGAHDGEPFEGIPASGAEASFDYGILLRMEDRKVAERWGTADDVMGMLVPLGYELVPPEE
jgi:ketosteroid isomerase-like protein